MAKVASRNSLSSASVQIGGSALSSVSTVRRKTPSELRGEQLKRTNILELVDESSAPVLGSAKNTNDVNGFKKQDLSRNPRYIDTRLDEVYPVKKSRLRMLSAKENTKENVQNEQRDSLKNITLLSTLAAKRQQLSCPNNLAASTEVPKDDSEQACQTNEKCSQSIFRSITDISSGVDGSSSLADVDMNKALKGLVACDPPTGSGSAAETSEDSGSFIATFSGNSCIKLHVAGQKAPLDFTLKSKLRVVTTCPINWIYRSVLSSSYNGMPQIDSQFGCLEGSSRPGEILTSQIVSSKALHSWVYPQSVLPPPVISALNSSAAESDFLRKRQLAWEDSFRNLYFMLRRKVCNLFYVCTSYFVVMFMGGDGLGNTKHQFSAYISRSTRGLRSLLREHDVCFSMPLSHSKVEQLNSEDLVELSEIEKQNLGQTRRLNLLPDVDNSPQSLLAFHGNKNVHGLYDFLLNYRSLLTSLSGVDVPILCSPIPFQNAAISAPEIRCVEAKRTDNVPNYAKEAEIKDGDSATGTSTSFLSTIEVKDSHIPPWIVCRICALVGSEGRTFEASFTTESSSIGLNVAFGTICDKSRPQTTGEGLQERSYAFGVPEAIASPKFSSGFLKSLKYQDCSYTATVSPL